MAEPAEDNPYDLASTYNIDYKPPPSEKTLQMKRYEAQGELDYELAKAAARGDVEEIRRLCAAGANTNHGDTLAKTPMHFAAIGCHTEALRALKDLGADHTARAMGGKTPLDWARVDNRGTKQHDKLGSIQLLESWN